MCVFRRRGHPAIRRTAACKQFRLPVVYLTAYSSKEVVERAKTTEPFGYILKPYDERELHVVIETALYKHRMDRRRQEREQWFVATLKSIGDAVITADDQGGITYMNPSAEHLTGRAKRDVLGQPLNKALRLVEAGSGLAVNVSFDRAMQDGTLRTGILHIAGDNSEKAVEYSISRIAGEECAALGSVVVIRDVTWRTLLDEQSRQVKKLEAVGLLAGGVAHAFNNLMTVMLGHTELMLDSMKAGDPFFASTREIQRSAQRTAKLVQKLLAFSRKKIMTLRTVDLNTVVGGLAQIIRDMRRGVQLKLSLEPGLGQMRANPEELEEAILTLARNACQAMPHGGRLTIQTAQVELGQDYSDTHPEVAPGQYAMLAVSDTGTGMAQDELSHLFEPFYTKEAGVGAGLGLAAAYGYVKQCGGDIEVRSQPEKGTTFRIYLPTLPGEQTIDRYRPGADAEPNTGL